MKNFTDNTLTIASILFGDLHISQEGLDSESPADQAKAMLSSSRKAMMQSLREAHKTGDKLKITAALSKRISGWLATLGRAVNKVKQPSNVSGFMNALHTFHKYFCGSNGEIHNSPFHKAMMSSKDRGMSPEDAAKWAKDTTSLFRDVSAYAAKRLRQVK